VVQLHKFLTTAADGGARQHHAVTRQNIPWYPEKDWVGPRASLECLREEKNVLAVPGIKPCIIQPTA